MRLCSLTQMPPAHQRRYILWAYRQTKGVTIRAAALLHVSKSTLLSYVDNLGLRQTIARRWPNVVRCALAAAHATPQMAAAS